MLVLHFRTLLPIALKAKWEGAQPKPHPRLMMMMRRMKTMMKMTMTMMTSR